MPEEVKAAGGHGRVCCLFWPPPDGQAGETAYTPLGWLDWWHRSAFAKSLHLLLQVHLSISPFWGWSGGCRLLLVLHSLSAVYPPPPPASFRPPPYQAQPFSPHFLSLSSRMMFTTHDSNHKTLDTQFFARF